MPNSYIKVNQKFDLFIINSKLIKRLALSIKPTNTISNHRLDMSVAKSSFIELKN